MSVFMDQPLACRIERAEGAIGVSFVEVRKRITPEVGAVWEEFGGAFALFDGPGSLMSQTFGVGIREPLTAATLDGIEAFFESRGSPVNLEVSPLAGIEAQVLISKRGYHPVELTTLLVRTLDDLAELPATAAGLRVRPCEEHELEMWIETSAQGWSEWGEAALQIRRIARVGFLSPTMTSFVVEEAGVPIGTGSLGIQDGVALLAGASTIPSGRGRGAQTLLLAARLLEAKRRGCDLAMMGATPGSTSQRNAERRGFRVAYTRTKWHRDGLH